VQEAGIPFGRFQFVGRYKGQKPGYLSSKWVRAESRIHVNNIKASELRVSALHHATAGVAVRTSIPRHEGRKPRAESRARCPNPGFLPNRTLAMSPALPRASGSPGGRPVCTPRPGMWARNGEPLESRSFYCNKSPSACVACARVCRTPALWPPEQGPGIYGDGPTGHSPGRGRYSRASWPSAGCGLPRQGTPGPGDAESSSRAPGGPPCRALRCTRPLTRQLASVTGTG
jgi:hypothetical protein